MDQERAIAIIRLARTLGRFDANVNHWHEYLCEKENGALPTKFTRTIAESAILRFRAFSRALGEAEEVAVVVLKGRRRHRVLMQLTLAHEALGQGDVPAELAVIDKFHDEAVRIMFDAGERLKKICRRRFAFLEADILAWFRVQPQGAGVDEPRRKCRLEVVQNESGDFAMLDGEPHAIRPAAADLLAAVIDAKGEWVSAAGLEVRSRDIQAMPKPIKELVEGDTGKGTRLKQNAWLS